MATKAQRQLAELRRLLSEMGETLQSPAVVDTLAKKTTKQIQRRTRAGFGLTTEETESARLQKLKLKDSSKKRRRNLKKKGELSGNTSPAKANLTRSGNMIDNLETKRLSNTEYQIEPNKVDQRKANELSKKGHKFLGLTTKELGSILSDSFRVFDRLIQKINKV